MTEYVEGTNRLEGINGWLVLFQIYIIAVVATSIQTALLGLLLGDLMNLGKYTPYYYALLAAALLIGLLCMIFFYRRKIVFRSLFIVYCAISIASSVLYLVYGENPAFSSAEFGAYSSMLTSSLQVFSLISSLIGVGILIAFVIALFKSKRVKNTFS